MSSIDFDEDERPSVTLASGRVLDADVVVGTEGTGSLARRAITGGDVPDINIMGMITFKSVVSRSLCEMLADLGMQPHHSTPSHGGRSSPSVATRPTGASIRAAHHKLTMLTTLAESAAILVGELMRRAGVGRSTLSAVLYCPAPFIPRSRASVPSTSCAYMFLKRGQRTS